MLSLVLILIFQSKVILCLLAATGIIFIVGLLYLAFLRRLLKSRDFQPVVQSKRIRSLRGVMFKAFWISVAFVLAASMSTNQTTAALQYSTETVAQAEIQMEIGNSVRILQWLILSISAVSTAGLALIFQPQDDCLDSAGDNIGSGAATFPEASTPQGMTPCFYSTPPSF